MYEWDQDRQTIILRKGLNYKIADEIRKEFQ